MLTIAEPISWIDVPDTPTSDGRFDLSSFLIPISGIIDDDATDFEAPLSTSANSDTGGCLSCETLIGI